MALKKKIETKRSVDNEEILTKKETKGERKAMCGEEKVGQGSTCCLRVSAQTGTSINSLIIVRHLLFFYTVHKHSSQSNDILGLSVGVEDNKVTTCISDVVVLEV